MYVIINLLQDLTKGVSATGNRTPVSRVTGGDTSHYTIAEGGRYTLDEDRTHDLGFIRPTL